MIRTLSTVLVVLFALFVVSLFGWGWNQTLTPDYLEPRLRLGMTAREANYALALHPGEIEKHLYERSDGTSVAVISGAGAVGSWFVPQYETMLTFDKEGRLRECWVQIVWRVDERGYPCKLADRDKEGVRDGR